jgi:hypothetical protein
MWIYPGFQEPPNDTTHHSLPQLLGPQYGTLQFLSALGVCTETHTIRTVEGQRQAVPIDWSRSHQVQQNWLPRLDITTNNTEILQAVISEPKNDPKGVAHPYTTNPYTAHIPSRPFTQDTFPRMGPSSGGKGQSNRRGLPPTSPTLIRRW